MNFIDNNGKIDLKLIKIRKKLYLRRKNCILDKNYCTNDECNV